MLIVANWKAYVEDLEKARELYAVSKRLAKTGDSTIVLAPPAPLLGAFAVKNKSGNLLVNPGAITRQTADQADFKPCVYLWYAEQNEVAPYYLLIEKDVISREHLEHEAERDARIEAFISRLSGEYEVAVSFEENLRRWVAANKVSDSVMDIVWAAVEEEK